MNNGGGLVAMNESSCIFSIKKKNQMNNPNFDITGIGCIFLIIKL